MQNGKEKETERFILLFKWAQSQHEFACLHYCLSFQRGERRSETS